MADPDLFGFVREEIVRQKQRRAVVVGWTLIDHVCRVCMGRLAMQWDQGELHVRCCECGTAVRGKTSLLCCCGTTLRTGEPAGLRCKRNPRQTAEAPAEIVVAYADPVSAQGLAPTERAEHLR